MQVLTQISLPLLRTLQVWGPAASGRRGDELLDRGRSRGPKVQRTGRHGERLTVKGAGGALAGLMGDLFICS